MYKKLDLSLLEFCADVEYFAGMKVIQKQDIVFTTTFAPLLSSYKSDDDSYWTTTFTIRRYYNVYWTIRLQEDIVSWNDEAREQTNKYWWFCSSRVGRPFKSIMIENVLNFIRYKRSGSRLPSYRFVVESNWLECQGKCWNHNPVQHVCFVLIQVAADYIRPSLFASRNRLSDILE